MSNELTAIDCDLPCAKCAYNLRGLSPTGQCPECGAGIPASIAEYEPRHGNPEDFGVDRLLYIAHLCLCAFYVTYFVTPHLILGHPLGALRSFRTTPFVGRAFDYVHLLSFVALWCIPFDFAYVMAAVGRILYRKTAPLVPSRERRRVSNLLISLLPHLYVLLNVRQIGGWFTV
ncbi:MAG: hypothetical protein HOP29_17750 [Phycisphaerales bacterium]|nr:hypothetical protein [Phycisphaerales bacterium]